MKATTTRSTKWHTRVRSLLVAAALAGLLGVVLEAAPAHAQTVVGCGADGNGDPNELVAAFNSANVGGGTLDLAPGCTYTLITTSDGVKNGLLPITSAITIHGNGATITRSQVSGTPEFRIFEVDSTGELAIDHITVSGG